MEARGADVRMIAAALVALGGIGSCLPPLPQPSPSPSPSPTIAPSATPEPTPEPTPDPIPIITPEPTPAPSAGCAPLLRIGVVLHRCEAKPDGTTLVIVNATPRIERKPGDVRGEEQPRACQDPRGPEFTQSQFGGWQDEPMEQTTGAPFLGRSRLPVGEYTFRAYPRSGVPLVYTSSSRTIPVAAGEVVVRVPAHGRCEEVTR